MKVVQINATCGVGSTGKICIGISRILSSKGIENYILYSSITDGYHLGIACSNDRYIKLQAMKSRVFGNYGFNSVKATKKMISEIERIQPDIVHVHNIHGHDCDIGMLVSYLKQNKIKTVWTFHDCWAFTGYCTHFEMIGCSKWQSGCYDCPQRGDYSFFFDKSRANFEKKRNLLKNFDFTIVTPSAWLADMVSKSFLDQPVKVIYNGIDLSIFKPKISDFRQLHNITPGKKVVLGVAFDWGIRKGLDVFLELEQQLDREKYQIVLVGANKTIQKQLPPGIISIPRTDSQSELAEIYTAADVFVNPTREEVLGLTNIEANACGTPVITFRSGGSPECIDRLSGVVVEKNDVSALKEKIEELCQMKPISSVDCRVNAERFDKDEKFMEYIRLYETVIGG